MLKVFVATSETQGHRSNDFCFVPEGELVYFGMECDNDDGPDGSCGCRRSLCGIVDGRGTTTMRVVPWENSEQALARMFRSVFIRHGCSATEADEFSEDMAQYIFEVTEDLPVGSVVERRGEELVIRSQPVLAA